MKMGIIVGSHRRDSQSGKVGRFIKKAAVNGKFASSIYLLNCGDQPLALWDEGMWTNDPKWQQTWGPIAAELRSCEAYIIVTPEYAGMVPAALKNIFLFCSKQELSNKPALLVALIRFPNCAAPVIKTPSYVTYRSSWCFAALRRSSIIRKRPKAPKINIFARAYHIRLSSCKLMAMHYGRSARLRYLIRNCTLTDSKCR
jgi:hypothetical protein